MAEAPAAVEAVSPAQESFIPEAPAASEAAPVAAPPAQESAAKAGEGETKPATDSFLDAEEEGKPSADADAKGDDTQKSAPEAYQPFDLPQGVDIDQPLLEAATPLFRELKLDQPGAQKLVSFYAELQGKAHAQLLSNYAQVKQDWAEASRSDPELGGDNLTRTKQHASQALSKLAPGARAVLVEYGLDRHPEVLRLLSRAGAKLSEDTAVHVPGAPQSRAPQRAADIMYGDN